MQEKFIGLSDQKILFRDKRGSGYSTKSNFTKIGGASNSLEVIILETELWLKASLWAMGMDHKNKNDLIHRIPMKNIKGVELIGKEIKLEFLTENEDPREIRLNLKNREEFIKIPIAQRKLNE